MNVTFSFRNSTVLVTGAAQGIGFEIASLFAKSGANVIALDRSAEAVEAAWGLDDRALPVTADVTDRIAVDAAVQDAVDRFGTIEIVVNNAGIARDGVVWKMTDDAWNDVLDVHLTGTFNVTRSVIPTMRAAQHGRIINITSYTGLHGNVGQANYAAAKAGIVGFTKTVAKEVARFGITVNAVSPNAETDLVAAIPAEQKARLESQVPLGRFGKPAEIGPGVAFLASEEAAYITGALLPIDGGLAM